MKKLTTYLLRSLTQALLLVTFSITVAVWLVQSLRYVDVVVENGAPLHMFVWLALLTLPTFLSMMLPIALFVAVLFTYNRLTHDSELIAMRACGLSPRLLAFPALLLAAIISLLGWSLSLWVQPAANRQLVEMQYFIQSQFSAALLREGTFNDLGDGVTVYVARREANAELQGLFIHDERNPQKPVTIRANRGQLVQGERGPEVVVYNGIQQEFDKNQKKLTELTFDSYAVDLQSFVKAGAIRSPNPRERSTWGIITGIATERDPLLQSRLLVELNQRFVGPLLALAFSIIAVCSLLLGQFSRRGQTHKIVLAVFLAVIVQAVVLALGQAVGRNAMALAPLYAAALIPILLGGWLLWRTGQGEGYPT